MGLKYGNDVIMISGKGTESRNIMARRERIELTEYISGELLYYWDV